MEQLNISLTLVGALIAALALFAGFIKSRVPVVSEPLLAVGVGIVVGPAVLAWITPGQWGDSVNLLEQLARASVAMAVMSIALRLPKGFFRAHLRTLGLILSIGMLVMWLVSGLLTYWLLGLQFWAALLVGAIVTPTDPVVSGSIVGGQFAEESIPARIRHTISAEAGANDGGAFPYVFLPLLLLTAPVDQALESWVLDKVLLGVVGAVALGMALGYLAGHIERWARRNDYPEETSAITVTVGLALAVLGAVKLLGSDGILAVFAAGLVFRRIIDHPLTERSFKTQEAVNRLVAFPLFVLFGALLPWAQWQSLGWPVLGLAVAVLALRRLPMVLALRSQLRTLHDRSDAWFVGWFGPLGAAAMFYAALAVRETHDERYWHIASLLIFASVIVHGATATLFTGWYRRHRQTGAEAGRSSRPEG